VLGHFAEFGGFFCLEGLLMLAPTFYVAIGPAQALRPARNAVHSFGRFNFLTIRDEQGSCLSLIVAKGSESPSNDPARFQESPSRLAVFVYDPMKLQRFTTAGIWTGLVFNCGRNAQNIGDVCSVSNMPWGTFR
jgi:hypothetical protein